MDCRDLERILVEEDSAPASPLPMETGEHLMACPSCRDLVRFLRNGEPVEAKSTREMLNRLVSVLEADLRPVRPIAPACIYTILLAGAAMSIAGIGAYCAGAFGLRAMSLVQAISVMSALSTGLSALAWSLSYLMVPGSRHPFPPKLLLTGILILLGIVLIVSFRMGDQTRFWQNGWVCVRFGVLFVVLATAPVWLLLRRGAVLAPRLTGTIAGLSAGLVGVSVLEIHCSNLDLAHILVFHLGVAALGALGGFAAGFGSEYSGRYGSALSFRRSQ